MNRRDFFQSLFSIAILPKLAGAVGKVFPATVPIEINQQWGQDFEFRSDDLDLSIARYGGRYLAEAEKTYANLIPAQRHQIHADCGWPMERECFEGID